MEILIYIIIGYTIYYFTVVKKELKKEGFNNPLESLDHMAKEAGHDDFADMVYKGSLKAQKEKENKKLDELNFEKDIPRIKKLNNTIDSEIERVIQKANPLQYEVKIYKDNRTYIQFRKTLKEFDKDIDEFRLSTFKDFSKCIVYDEWGRENSKLSLSYNDEILKKYMAVNPSILEIPHNSHLSLEEDEDYFADISEDELDAIFNTENIPMNSNNEKYNTIIKDIENPSFEKIRRYYNNLISDNQADEMITAFAKNGKMYKALVYDAMEQFLEDLEDESLTIIDWGCGQGLAVSLVLDYINEKQLDIEVEKVILIDEDEKALQRASLHVDILKEDDLEIEALHVKGGELEKELHVDSETTILNLFANDTMPVDFFDIDDDIFNGAYFVFLSSKSKSYLNRVYEELCTVVNVENVSLREGKVGKYMRFERIYKNINNGDNNILDIYIDEDEIPF